MTGTVDAGKRTGCGDQVAALRNAIAIYSSNGGINKTSLEYSNLHIANHNPHLLRDGILAISSDLAGITSATTA